MKASLKGVGTGTGTQKDFIRRSLARKTEARSLAFKALQNNGVKRYPSGCHGVYYRNRCVLTGRPRGVHNWFKISRLMIRELASKGLLPGLKKAS